MLEQLTTAWVAVKGSTPIPLTAIAVSTGFMLLAPKGVLTTLGLDQIRFDYQAHLGIAFVGAVSFLLAQGSGWLVAYLKTLWQERQKEKSRLAVLQRLTPEEKGYLAFFQHENTCKFPMDDGIAGGLAAKGIIYRSSNIFHVLEGIPYNLQPWAQRHLQENPQLLEGGVVRARSPYPY